MTPREWTAAEWRENEERQRVEAEQNAGLIRERLAVDEMLARAVGFDRFEAVDYLWDTKYLQLSRPDGATKNTDALDPDLAVHAARHDPRRVIDQCGSISEAVGELEWISDRSPDPDSRMHARLAIVALRRIWEPDDE